ncbi:hypothetical protein FQN49_003305 [Arthroderma sp. PD_2]|nr:hypothetical protein FQN49_003305 [Arthroderma sp. PD_2]
MPDIQPQVDLGQLSLQGLSSLTPLLVALSADNVSPMAMIQMEQLGAILPISGRYAAKVPDYLQRCSSNRLNRLSLLIGWQKDDSASYMAKSAGGQAIALLSTCLVNMFGKAKTGDILFGLSQEISSSSISVASGAQLQEVASCLASKLAVIGFGNVLAAAVSRVHDVYTLLQKPMPTDSLDEMTTESAVKLLQSLSQVLPANDTCVRIYGTQSLSYIFAFVMIMFPLDAVVSVDNEIIFEGERKSIMIEFGVAGSLTPTEIVVETIVNASGALRLPIVVNQRDSLILPGMCLFRFDGWLADYLRLVFLNKEINIPEELLVACCETLISLVDNMNYSRGEPSRAQGRLIHLLGARPYERMVRICRTVFGVSPLTRHLDLKSAFDNLTHHFISTSQPCSCSDTCCDVNRGWGYSPTDPLIPNDWKPPITRDPHCPFRILWKALGQALDHGLASFFINANANVVVPFPSRSAGAMDTIHGHPSGSIPDLNIDNFHAGIMGCFSSPEHPDTDMLHRCLAVSESSTIYPGRLRRLELDHENGLCYELVDGVLQLNGRYHKVLRNAKEPLRQEASKSLYSNSDIIVPSSSGVHSDLVLTLRELSSYLELRCIAVASKTNVPIDLSKVIVTSYGVKQVDPCEHRVYEPLRGEFQAITTSVQSPRARTGCIAVAQVSRNKTAQLLCCESSGPILLQRNCCLNCACEQARNYSSLIITY